MLVRKILNYLSLYEKFHKNQFPFRLKWGSQWLQGYLFILHWMSLWKLCPLWAVRIIWWTEFVFLLHFSSYKCLSCIECWITIKLKVVSTMYMCFEWCVHTGPNYSELVFCGCIKLHIAKHFIENDNWFRTYSFSWQV